MRYKIVEESQSSHCCFGYTIVDTSKPQIIGDTQWVKDDGSLEWEGVCECFEKHQAELICNALNGVVK
jgi:hypothetical protein